MRLAELDIRQLRAFVALVEQGHVTAAADVLGLAQSTVSESLAALERVVGVRVVLRSSGRRPTQLTTAGEALLPHARAALAAVDRARMAIAGSTANARAVVKIAANESVSTYLLPPLLARLRARWPKTGFSVSVVTCAEADEGVLAGPFDVGVTIQSGSHRSPLCGNDARAVESRANVERRILVSDVSLVVLASPSHPLLRRSRTAVRREYLASYPLFVTDASGEFYSLVRRFFNAQGEVGACIEATGSVESVKKAVAAGEDCLGLLPAYAVAEDLRLGSLASLAVRPEPPHLRLEARLPRRRSRHPAVEELLDMLRNAPESASDAFSRIRVAHSTKA